MTGGILVVLKGLVVVFSASSFVSVPAEAASWQQKPASMFALPTPEKVGVFQHPVIYASSEVAVEQVRRSQANVKQKLVVQWGLHVFEIVEALYTCTTVADCEYEDFNRIATYELCEVKRGTVTCTGRLAGNDGTVENDSPRIHDTFDVEPERGGSDFDVPERNGPTSSEEYTR